MSIERFFTTTITNKRMEWSNDSSAEVSVGSFIAHVQQATPELANYIGELWAKTFVIWCAKGTDVDAGDTLTISAGDYAGTFSIKNIQKNATGDNEHLEITAVKDV